MRDKTLRILDRIMSSYPMEAVFATRYGQVAEDIYHAFRWGGFRYGLHAIRETAHNWPKRHMTIVCINGDHGMCLCRTCKCKCHKGK